jgi:branched-chain amino acid transport system permease protein
MIADFLTNRVVNDVVGGATQGVIISLVALCLVLVWRATRVLNFAQGPMAMFVTYIGMTQMEHGLNFWVAAALSVAVGFAFSALTEIAIVKPLYHKAEINPIVVMVGLFTLLEALASAIWTNIPRYPVAPFSSINFQSNGNPTGLSPLAAFQIIAALAVMAFIAGLFNYTSLGLKLRASALAPEVSKLLGLRVSRLLTLGWGIAGAVGAVAGVVISVNPSGLAPNMLDALFILGFIAAAIGGLDSPLGALVAGVGIGITMQLINDYWNSNYADMVAVIMLVVALMVRPQGMFTKNSARRV